MKTIILALALILGLSTNVWAAAHTATHTYIVDRKESRVLAIDRQTGAEMFIPVGSLPVSVVIHDDFGYVVNALSSNISVIDLKTNTVTHTIPVHSFPISIEMYDNRGYVAHNTHNNVSVIDLQTNTVTKRIAVGQNPQVMMIHGDMGYVVNNSSNNVSVINLKTNTVSHTIPVGTKPETITIHGELGYVVNNSSNDVSVINLKTNTVTQTIPVGSDPETITIQGDMGYVVNQDSNNISVIDLKTNTVTQTIPIGNSPRSMVIYGGMAYIKHTNPSIYTALDLQTNRITTFKNPSVTTIDFSDTHVYVGHVKMRPFYPTLASINLVKARGTLGEFVNMMPEVFQLGEIEPRLFPREENVIDTVPPYALAQEFFWDLVTGKPLMDPQDILATLVTMKYPQKFLQTEAGAWLRKRLHMAFFQSVWMDDKDKVKAMLTYFVQLQDPVITNLATYTFKGAKKSSDQKATNSTDMN